MITRLLRGNQSAPTTRQQAFADVDATLEKAKRIPPLSATVTRAMAVANDPSYRFHEFVEVVKSDGAITALLLKVANSVLYRGTREVRTVEQAVNRLGMKPCNQIIAAVGMKGTFKHNDPEVQERIDGLWRHSLLTAYLCTNLAAALKMQLEGEEFTAGLLHDIGRLVLTIADSSVAKNADPLSWDEGEDHLIQERVAMGVDHCRLGEEYANRQNFPRSIVQVISNHHTPLSSSQDTSQLVHLVFVADQLSNHVLREHKIANYDPTTCSSLGRLARQTRREEVMEKDYISKLVVDSTRQTRAALRANFD